MENTKEIKEKTAQKKRRKLTLYRKFYDDTKKQSDTDRLAIYDAVLGYGFDGIPIDYSKLSNVAEIIVTNMAIELNKMKSQFENGCVEKTTYNTDVSTRPNFESQKQATTEPKSLARTRTHASNYINNILYNINNLLSNYHSNNLLNNNNLSINQSSLQTVPAAFSGDNNKKTNIISTALANKITQAIINATTIKKLTKDETAELKSSFGKLDQQIQLQLAEILIPHDYTMLFQKLSEAKQKKLLKLMPAKTSAAIKDELEKHLYLSCIKQTIDDWNKSTNLKYSMTALRLYGLLKKVELEQQPFNVLEEELDGKEILGQIANVFTKNRADELLKKYETLFNKIDNDPAVHNKYKYLVPTVLNEAVGI